MGLETGNYISDLVPSNPGGGDDVSAGDDHIRLLKSILQTTFPNINGAVNATPAELNIIAGLIATTAQLNAIASLTANRALVTDGSGNITASGTISDTEINYLNGVTSNLQAQLNDLQAQITAIGTVPDASETVKGIVELANATEVAALADITRAITPGRLPSAFTITGNAMKLPGGAVIAQGTSAIIASGFTDIALGISMPSAAFAVTANWEGPGIATTAPSTKAFDVNTVRISNGNAVPLTANWTAIGLS